MTREMGVKFSSSLFLTLKPWLENRTILKKQLIFPVSLGKWRKLQRTSQSLTRRKTGTKKKLENFSWTHGRAKVKGQVSNTKSGERQAPAGRKENQSHASAYLGQTLPSTTLADKKIQLNFKESLICQQIWKTQQWPQDWKRSVFIPIPKKGNAKECLNYNTIALISVQFSSDAQ